MAVVLPTRGTGAPLVRLTHRASVVMSRGMNNILVRNMSQPRFLLPREGVLRAISPPPPQLSFESVVSWRAKRLRRLAAVPTAASADRHSARIERTSAAEDFLLELDSHGASMDNYSPDILADTLREGRRMVVMRCHERYRHILPDILELMLGDAEEQRQDAGSQISYRFEVATSAGEPERGVAGQTLRDMVNRRIPLACGQLVWLGCCAVPAGRTPATAGKMGLII